MSVESKTAKSRSRVDVPEHSLGAVSERIEGEAFRSDGNRCPSVVQILVGLPSESLPKPTIRASGAVDAQENAEPDPIFRVIHVSEAADAGARVGADDVGDTINHSRGPGCRRDLPGLERVQRQRIRRLVAGAKGHRDAGGKSEGARGLRGQASLLAERGDELGK